MKTLNLFHTVPLTNHIGGYKFLSDYGVIVHPNASYAIKEIEDHLSKNALSGQQLNQSFHKSWRVIVDSEPEQLRVHQILHYFTTYGTDFTSDFIYVPNEVLQVPEIKLGLRIIKAASSEELIKKCFLMLNSGAALKQETIIDILDVLSVCKYVFTGSEQIRNKETLMHIYQLTGKTPQDSSEFIRYLYFVLTGETLLIKNKYAFSKIKNASKDKIEIVEKNILARHQKTLAPIFNRYKPFLLEIKKLVSPYCKRHINQISKLSKTLHTPLQAGILNNIGNCTLDELKNSKKVVLQTPFFQLARCLNYLKLGQSATHKNYLVRNGNAFCKEVKSFPKNCESKLEFLVSILQEKYLFKNEKVYIPDGVSYALPTSEKNFVGNVPIGTTFSSSEPISIGIYWHNDGGAIDIDLAALTSDGKVGWNSSYKDEVMFSGDMTDARNGAVEYIQTMKHFSQPHIISANIFRGEINATANIVIGKGAEISKPYMMNPNGLWMTSQISLIKKQSIVGLLYRDNGLNHAVIFNMGVQNSIVSSNTPITKNFRTAVIQKFSNEFKLKEILAYCGAKFVNNIEDATIDLSPKTLNRETIMGMFSNK